MTALDKITIGQTHKAPAVQTVRKAFNTGGRSTLIKMAINPSSRPKVESHRDDAVWQAIHCRERGQGPESASWWRVAKDIQVVLAGTRLLHEARSRKVGR